MVNRRKDYRHCFAAHERLGVAIVSPQHREPVSGSILDLSLGGMRLAMPAPCDLQPGENIEAHIQLSPELQPFIWKAHIVHAAAARGEYGCRFHSPVYAIARETREKLLWTYLLRAQCPPRRHGDHN